MGSPASLWVYAVWDTVTAREVYDVMQTHSGLRELVCNALKDYLFQYGTLIATGSTRRTRLGDHFRTNDWRVGVEYRGISWQISWHCTNTHVHEYIHTCTYTNTGKLIPVHVHFKNCVNLVTVFNSAEACIQGYIGSSGLNWLHYPLRTVISIIYSWYHIHAHTISCT